MFFLIGSWQSRACHGNSYFPVIVIFFIKSYPFESHAIFQSMRRKIPEDGHSMLSYD